MKKKNLKALALHRETLRNLSDPRLLHARGGVTGVPCTGSCTCTTCMEEDAFKTEGTACCQ